MRPGDTFEVLLTRSDVRAYIHVIGEEDPFLFVRILAGRFDNPLLDLELEKLVDGPEEFVVSMLDSRLPEFVMWRIRRELPSERAPKWWRLFTPRTDDERQWTIMSSEGKRPHPEMSPSEFERSHPDVDQYDLPLADEVVHWVRLQMLIESSWRPRMFGNNTGLTP